MPIKIPAGLPAETILAREGVMLMREDEAARQDIRPLRIALVNLMPDKIRTEAQIARLIGATPLQIELTLIKMASHTPKTAPPFHMLSFYEDWETVKDVRFDGMIVTGAPIEHMPFEDVHYWGELTEMFEWSRSHVHSLLSICWGAQAALYHFHGVPKHDLDAKAFGVFRHRNLAPASPYLRGFSDDFSIPVSRWTEVRRDDLPDDAGLQVLMESPDTGLCLIAEPRARRLYMFNHIEYDSTSLAEEYGRDKAKGVDIAFPANYFPGDDDTRAPENRWRSHAHLFFGNWINEVYQSTAFDPAQIGREGEGR
jgi:homoserine O-succinyltransferase